MDLRFNLLSNLSSVDTPYIPIDAEYVELHNTLMSAQQEFIHLNETLRRVCVAQNFLQSHQVDNGLYSYLCDTFGLEEYIGLPKGCINSSNTKAYTEVCLEGFGSLITSICTKIVEFFKKLYETIMHFFGIRSFRHRKLENELIRIKRTVNNIDEYRFQNINDSNIQVNVPTITTDTMDTICSDMENLNNLIHQSADIENIKTMVTATSGILTKMQYKVVDEYRIDGSAGFPYTEIIANIAITPGSSLHIRGKADVVGRIDRILKLQKEILDLQRWYPMNLKKYAARAEKLNKTNEGQAQKDLQVLNEDQMCQAYLCKLILIYMQVVDYLCARTVASFGIYAIE